MSRKTRVMTPSATETPTGKCIHSWNSSHRPSWRWFCVFHKGLEKNFWLLLLFIVVFSCQVMSDSSQPQGLKRARLPCPSSSPFAQLHTRSGVFRVVCPYTGVCPTHVHWISDTIQSSYSLSPPSLPALSRSQHQDLNQWVSSLQVAKVLELPASASVLPVNIQGWFPLRMTGFISLPSRGLPIK